MIGRSFRAFQTERSRVGRAQINVLEVPPGHIVLWHLCGQEVTWTLSDVVECEAIRGEAQSGSPGLQVGLFSSPGSVERGAAGLGWKCP